MKPDRMEFKVGQTIHGQPLKLIYERGNGKESWTIYQEAQNQRDDPHGIMGIDLQTLLNIGKVAESFQSKG